MKIDLSKHEVELIDNALQEWEAAAQRDSCMGMMVEALVTPREERAHLRQKIAAERASATQEQQRRRRVATLLRAKLFQAEASDSEHTVEREVAPPDTANAGEKL